MTIPFTKWMPGKGIGNISAREVNRAWDILSKLDRLTIEGYLKDDMHSRVHFRKRSEPAAVSAALAAAGAAHYQVLDVNYETSELTCQRWDFPDAPSGESVTVHFPHHLHPDSFHLKTINYHGIGNVEYAWLGDHRRRGQRAIEVPGSVPLISQQEEWITPPYVTAAGADDSTASAILAIPVPDSEGTRLVDITGNRTWAQAAETFDL